MERTLVILKPDAIQRGLVGEVITRFERAGLKIVGMKMVQPDPEHYHKHYEEISKLISRTSQEVFDLNLDFMMLGPVIVFVLEGMGAVALVRKMVGVTQPSEAAPGTIRGDYSHISFDHANTANTSIPNIVHASGDVNEAKLEVKLWFNDDELFGYQTANEHYTQPTKPYKKHS